MRMALYREILFNAVAMSTTRTGPIGIELIVEDGNGQHLLMIKIRKCLENR